MNFFFQWLFCFFCFVCFCSCSRSLPRVEVLSETASPLYFLNDSVSQKTFQENQVQLKKILVEWKNHYDLLMDSLFLKNLSQREDYDATILKTFKKLLYLADQRFIFDIQRNIDRYESLRSQILSIEIDHVQQISLHLRLKNLQEDILNIFADEKLPPSNDRQALSLNE